MSASVNSVVLVGRLTRDPELRKTTNGVSYCRFTLACDRRSARDSQETTADFISCIAWRQSADFVGNYGQKGDLFSVEGSIQTGSYTDREGRKVYTTDVLVDRVQSLESKKGSSKADYPSRGTSLRREDIDANDGFDLGDESAEVDPDDLPF